MGRVKSLIQAGLVLLVCLGLAFPAPAAKKGEAGVVSIKTASGKTLDLYGGSHALVIGVGNYTAGWPRLDSVPEETAQVVAALKAQGFSVRTVLDPNGRKLQQAFESFINQYGFDPDNRLVFFFSGHGWSREDGRLGYLVPSDAPRPSRDLKGFKRTAVSMSQVLTWCREMDSRHALFVFDSCFAGTIFETRSLENPPHINDYIAKPVRYFITAGSAKEQVPARSVFVPSFVRGLRGEADLNHDGYITGTEFGMYLHDKVAYYRTGQTPQYGKIRDPNLDEGDFVFLSGYVPQAVETPRAKPEPEPRALQPAAPETYAGPRPTPAPARGSAELEIRSKPPGARVSIDGRDYGLAPFTLRGFMAGEHLVELELMKNGERLTHSAKVEVRPGYQSMRFILEQSTGSLSVFSRPSGANVWLDGTLMGRTPLFLKGLETGNRNIKLDKSQNGAIFAYHGKVNLRPGQNRLNLRLNVKHTQGGYYQPEYRRVDNSPRPAPVVEPYWGHAGWYHALRLAQSLGLVILQPEPARKKVPPRRYPPAHRR